MTFGEGKATLVMEPVDQEIVQAMQAMPISAQGQRGRSSDEQELQPGQI